MRPLFGEDFNAARACYRDKADKRAFPNIDFAAKIRAQGERPFGGLC
jgi:hypothetical protein